jgi:uncharacterized damage-inducible protein DinB
MTTSSTPTKSSNDALKGYFIELAEFTNWADNRAIDWLNQITNNQWNQAAISSFPSIRETAIHIASAKKVWIDMWTQVPNPVYLSSEFKGTKEELIDIWKTVSTELRSFIENYPLENYSNEIAVKKPNGELSTMEFHRTFPHMVNHATYHRGQLVTLLRQSGFSNFSNTDLFTYYNT